MTDKTRLERGGIKGATTLAEARRLAASGARIVGVIGWRVPVEPILAAGMVPIVVRPDLSAPTPDADALLSTGEKPAVRSLVQMIIGGGLAFADLIVIAPPFTAVSLSVEELRRLDLVPRDVPGTCYFELPVERNEPNRVFALDRIAALASRVSSAAGSGRSRPTEDALDAAISDMNRVRRAARNLEQRRTEPGAPSGSAVMAVMGEGDWRAPADHAARIDALAGETFEIRPGPRVLVVSSSVLGDARLHALVEEAGGLVVGEDDIYGSCFADGEIPERSGEALAAIANFYHDNQPPQRTSPEEVRRRWYRQAVQRPDVSHVLFYAEYAFWGWDLPSMREVARDAGKQSLTLELDVRIAADRAAAQDKLQRFLMPRPESATL